MDDDLIDSSRLSLTRKSLLPGAGFFYPDSLDEEAAERRAREAVEDAEVVVVTDSDADGLGCLALIREAYDAALDPEPFLEDLEERVADMRGEAPAPDEADAAAGTDGDDEPAGSDGDAGPVDSDVDGDDLLETVLEEDAVEAEAHARSPVALLPSGPRSLASDLENAAAFAPEGVDVFVCDLCPDSYESVGEALETLTAHAAGVRWFDHHQWDDDVARQVREAGADLVVGESDEECTADVALRSLAHEFSARFRDLARVTRDHDLWIKEDPRSDDLSDFAYWVDPEAYVAVVGAHGADLPAVAEDYVAERRIEKENLIERAVERAEFKQVGPWTVGVTYGRCSQNEVAEALRTRGADAAVVVKPAGSASIRGSDGFERAHLVARQVEGGGHPRAAGCKPDIYDDMLDYAHHWSTQGSAAKRVILQAFERVAEAAAEEGAAAQDEAAAEEGAAAQDEAAAEEAEAEGRTVEGEDDGDEPAEE